MTLFCMHRLHACKQGFTQNCSDGRYTSPSESAIFLAAGSKSSIFVTATPGGALTPCFPISSAPFKARLVRAWPNTVMKSARLSMADLIFMNVQESLLL